MYRYYIICIDVYQYCINSYLIYEYCNGMYPKQHQRNNKMIADETSIGHFSVKFWYQVVISRDNNQRLDNFLKIVRYYTKMINRGKLKNLVSPSPCTSMLVFFSPFSSFRSSILSSLQAECSFTIDSLKAILSTASLYKTPKSVIYTERYFFKLLPPVYQLSVSKSLLFSL